MPENDDGDQDTMNETYREMVDNLDDSADEYIPEFNFSSHNLNNPKANNIDEKE